MVLDNTPIPAAKDHLFLYLIQMNISEDFILQKHRKEYSYVLLISIEVMVLDLVSFKRTKQSNVFHCLQLTA